MEFKNIKTGFSYFAINKKTSFIVQVQITPVKHYTANKKFFILLKLFSWTSFVRVLVKITIKFGPMGGGLTPISPFGYAPDYNIMDNITGWSSIMVIIGSTEHCFPIFIWLSGDDKKKKTFFPH